MATISIWDRLSAEEFQQLQEYTKYSKRRLKDVLREFREGLHQKYNLEEPMGYSGFKLFMSSYLGEDISDELCQTLFWAFHKKVPASQVSSPNLPNPLLRKFLDEYQRDSIDSVDTAGDSRLTQIAKGARRATVVATATVVAGIRGELRKDGNHSSVVPANSMPHIDLGKDSEDDSGSHDADESPNRVINHKQTTDDPPKRPVSQTEFPSSNRNHRMLGEGGSKSHSFDETASHSTRRGHASQQAKSQTHGLLFMPMIEIKEIACYLSLLEGGDVKDKLEFVFRVYDTDDNNNLDQQELESIVQQMIRVAEYLGWDTCVLKPLLNDMLTDLDCDSDGQISLEEWIKGGLNNIPFLVLLGMDVKVDEDGKHQWQMRHFKTQAFCNICHSALTGFAKKQGFQCIFCRYTVHARCVSRAPHSCIQTYTTSKTKRQTMDHHWVEGNCPGKCDKCGKTIKSNCLTGLHCKWCQMQIHNRCVQSVHVECSLGPNKVHILPPISITPQTVKKNGCKLEHKNSVISYDGIPLQVTSLPGTQPLCVFVNPKSGGRQGARILNKFRYLLNPRQVFNLADGGPLPGLKFFSQVPNFRVLCCGGDGTAGWILSIIDKLNSLQQRPPMAILPLGTGNDLARCLNWGGGYDGSSLAKYLYKVSNSSVVMLDRWQIELEEHEKSEDTDTMPQNIMNNYFSIGVDAAIALKFHLQREKNPEKFNSRFKNKLRYFEAGTSEQLAASCKNLQDDIEIICDGAKLDLSNYPNLEGIAILNICSIYGGANIWGESDKKRKGSQSDGDLGTIDVGMGDKLVEVVGLENSLYVGQIIAGVRQHGIRLAQCGSIVLNVKRTLPMQIDGEPWMQSSATVSISHKNQTPMCVAPISAKKGLFTLFRSPASSSRNNNDT